MLTLKESMIQFIYQILNFNLVSLYQIEQLFFINYPIFFIMAQIIHFNISEHQFSPRFIKEFYNPGASLLSWNIFI